MRFAPRHVLCVLTLVLIFVCAILLSCDNDSSKADADQETPATLDDDSTPADDEAPDDDADDDSAEIPKPPHFDPMEPGPYPVGNRTFFFEDASRYDPITDGPRSLVTEIWYPAADEAAQMPRDIVRNFFGEWADFIFDMMAEEGVSQEEIDNFDQETGSVRDAPINSDGGPYPIIVFSHGFGGLRFQNFTMCEYLAGHGYIVIAPDHTGNALVAPFPDSLVLFDEQWTIISYWQRKGDISFLIDTLTEMNADYPEGFLAGLVDAARVGAMGHSFGGTAAGEATRDDPRIEATVIFASFMFPWFTGPFEASLMYVLGLEDDTMGDATFLFRYDYRISPPPKFKLEFFDGGHYTFTDACILLSSMGDGDGCGTGERRWGGEEFEYIDHDRAMGIINPSITAFYGFRLKGDQEMRPFLSENHFPEDINYDWKWE